MELKQGVKVGGLKPEALLAMMVAKDIVEAFGVVFVVTSVAEGKHRPDSLHYKGLAFDIRTRDMTVSSREQCANAIREALGKDFDVVYGDAAHLDHIHVEFDPK